MGGRAVVALGAVLLFAPACEPRIYGVGEIASAPDPAKRDNRPFGPPAIEHGAAIDGVTATFTPGRAFYLAPTGDDAAEGTFEAPIATLVEVAQRMKPGDVAYLRGGTYDFISYLYVSGIEGVPVSFAAYPGETPLLTNTEEPDDTLVVAGQHVVLDGLKVTNAVRGFKAVNLAGTARDVLVENCEIFGARGQGIIVSGQRNLLFRNRIHDNGASGKYDHGVYLQGSENIVRSNAIYLNWANGVQVYNGYNTVGGDNRIEFNYIFGNGTGSTLLGNYFNAGVVVGLNQPNTVIQYNRICANQQFAVYVIDQQTGTRIIGNVTCYSAAGGLFPEAAGGDTVLAGNLSYNDGGFALGIDTGVSSDTNVFWADGVEPRLVWKGKDYGFYEYQSVSGQDPHSVLADPRFRSAPVGGFDPGAAFTYDFCSPLMPALCLDP